MNYICTMQAGRKYIRSFSIPAILIVLSLAFALLAKPAERNKSALPAATETRLSAESPGLLAPVTSCIISSTEINGKDSFGLFPVHIAVIHHERIIVLKTLLLEKNYREKVKCLLPGLLSTIRLLNSDDLPDLS